MSGLLPALPARWETAPDAVCTSGEDDLFLFRGSEYLRYRFGGESDWASGTGNVRSLFAGFTRVDAAAACLLPPSPAGPPRTRGYFFSGERVCAVDLPTAGQSTPRPIRDVFPSLPPEFHSGVDCAVTAGNERTVYLFRGATFTQFDPGKPGDRSGGNYQVLPFDSTNWPGLRPAAARGYPPMK